MKHNLDLHHEDVIRDGYKNILDKIKSYLSGNLGYGYTFIEYHCIGYKEIGYKEVALKFRCNIPEGGKIEIDLLLSPYWEQDSYYKDLRGIKDPKDRQL